MKTCDPSPPGKTTCGLCYVGKKAGCESSREGVRPWRVPPGDGSVDGGISRVVRFVGPEGCPGMCVSPASEGHCSPAFSFVVRGRASWTGSHGQGAVVSSLGTREVLGKGERLEVPPR